MTGTFRNVKGPGEHTRSL